MVHDARDIGGPDLYVAIQTQVTLGDPTRRYSIVRDFVMKWDDMEYTGHRKFFYVLVVVPEVLFMLRSHNVSQQVRWRDGCWVFLQCSRTS